MAQCLFDPQYGYYTTREPFGASGDFITAPEISQMFGEMLAAWWLSARSILNLPDLLLAEAGPGRGTLMNDMLRTMKKVSTATNAAGLDDRGECSFDANTKRASATSGHRRDLGGYILLISPQSR